MFAVMYSTEPSVNLLGLTFYNVTTVVLYCLKPYCSIYQRAVTDRIRNFNKRISPCVSVDVSSMLINYKSFEKFVEIVIYM